MTDIEPARVAEDLPRPTHEVLNQPPPFGGRNLFDDDPALVAGVTREGAAHGLGRAAAIGALASGAPMRWGAAVNEHPPVLRTHDRYGHRIDEVEFHPH